MSTATWRPPRAACWPELAAWLGPPGLISVVPAYRCPAWRLAGGPGGRGRGGKHPWPVMSPHAQPRAPARAPPSALIQAGRAMHDRNALRPAGHHAPGYQPVGPQRIRGPVDSGLAGTGLVADDLYLMAHHDVSGRALLQPRPLGIGLGGALLAELMLGGGITLRY